MTRYTKDSHGHYHIHGKKYEMLEGSRAQVYHGTAYKTSGGLKKPEILMNKNGRIVSKKKHTTAKKERRLVKAGYGTKKGKFGFVKIGQSKKMRGGKMGALAPMDLGANVPTSQYGAVGGSRRRRGGTDVNNPGTGFHMAGGSRRRRRGGQVGAPAPASAPAASAPAPAASASAIGGVKPMVHAKPMVSK